MRNSGNPVPAADEDWDEVVAAAVRRQQQILLVHQAPLMMGINILIAVLVCGFMSAFVRLWPIAAWLAVMLSVSGWQIHTALILRRRPAPDRVSGHMLKRAEYWTAFMGLLWASLPVFFFADQPADHQMFLALVIMGLAWGCEGMLPLMPRICAIFGAAALTPLIMLFVLDGRLLYLTVAVLFILFYFGLVSSSYRALARLEAFIVSSLQVERLRSDLVDAIESIKDAFAICDKDGEIKLSNERFKTWFGDAGNLSEVTGTESLYRMPGGVWLQGSVRPMSSGGKVSVHTDVTDLKNRERELIAAKLKAEEASSAKSHFLAHMSHELRTPLNAIMGFAEVMCKGMFGPLGDERYKQYAGDIHDSATHLLSIITDILNLSRIQSSDYELTFDNVDISEITRWALDTCRRQRGGFDARGIDVLVDPDFGLIRADAAALKQVLLNLISNAAKFTPRSGQITVEAFIGERGQPCISVSDTGIGIPDDKLDAVRQPFHQVESTFQRKFRGTGLGLSISDALIKLHGGKLELESQLGRGTRVTVILPPELRVSDRQAARAS